MSESSRLCKKCHKREIVNEFYAVCVECRYAPGRKSIGEIVDQLGKIPALQSSIYSEQKVSENGEAMSANNLVGIKKQELKKDASTVLPQEGHPCVQAKDSSLRGVSKETLQVIVLISFWLFIAYIFLGGILFPSDYDATHTIRIDCSDPGYAKNNQFCNGTYQSGVNEQDYNESSYYQNIVR